MFAPNSNVATHNRGGWVAQNKLKSGTVRAISGPVSQKRVMRAKKSAKFGAFYPHTAVTKRFRALTSAYVEALRDSRATGRPVSIQIDVDPTGALTVRSLQEEAVLAQDAEDAVSADADLKSALSEARERGELLAAKILDGPEMLSAQDLAEKLGISRVTVNIKRQSGQILGLQGAKRGFRFPIWQINSEGAPYPEIARLHEILGAPWAVYRFLVQAHGELDGLTGRQVLERGRVRLLLAAAESVARDF